MVAVMMLGSQNDILHTSLLSHLCPGSRIIMDRIKFLSIRSILFQRDLLHTHDPFATANNGIQAPVNEHAEAVITEPLHPFFSFFNNSHKGSSF